MKESLVERLSGLKKRRTVLSEKLKDGRDFAEDFRRLEKVDNEIERVRDAIGSLGKGEVNLVSQASKRARRGPEPKRFRK